MFRDWVVGKSRLAAGLLALGLLVSPAAAQQPAPPSPPDLTWRGAASDEAQPRPPLVEREPSLCRDPLCRAQLDGDLWKKGGVALSITPFNW